VDELTGVRQPGGFAGLDDAKASVRSEAEDSRRSREQSHPLRHTVSSTKSPGAILDAGALWRRRANREGQDGPSQSHPLRQTSGRAKREGQDGPSLKIAWSDFGGRSAYNGVGSKYINQGEDRMVPNKSSVAAMVVLSAVLGACAQTGGSTSTRPDADNQQGSTHKIGPGMNANGEVIDATKVESGYGQKVKGINDFEGEVTGVPNGRFSQLQIGMGIKQVMDIAGPPTDQGAYITGKAFIPFYFGSDRSRFELLYKGQGRLIFAGGSVGNLSGGNLIWIINSATEPGYR
jgi:hypothetical protein